MFALDEIKNLMEALDAWEDVKPTETLMNGLLAMLVGGEENLNEVKAAVDEKMEEANKIRDMRKEQAILLKAKLLGLRDQAEASEAAEFLSGDIEE